MKGRIKSATAAISLLGIGAAILSLVPAALAHGGEESGMDMMEHGHGHGEAPKPSEGSYPDTYFSHPELQGVLYAHIALMVLGWVFVLPVAVMFSIARSRYTFPSQLVFGIVNCVGLILGMIYNDGTPDLYPGNAHHKLGWVVTAISYAQIAVSGLSQLAGAFSTNHRQKYGNGMADERRSFITPVSAEAMAEHQRINGGGGRTAAAKGHHRHHGPHGPYRYSDDSGHGTESNIESLRSPTLYSPASSSHHDEEAAMAAVARKEEGLHLRPLKDYEGEDAHYDKDDDDDDDDDEDDGPSFAQRLDAALGCGAAGPAYRATKRLAGRVSSSVWKVLIFGYNIVDRVILVLGFIALCTGVITQGRFFEGHEIYSGLAHWIKGGVFFWLGLVTLGRWSGAFGELGWAWNVRPPRAAEKWRPSAEFVESALIFFYGSTNIFLEHLGNNGDGKWSAQDLEHVSITVLFIGGGLCGMLVESSRVRDLLNTTVELEIPSREYRQGSNHNDDDRLTAPPRQYGVSLNPIPALVILLLGIMMSSHTQTNMVSSMVHKQWGTLLTGASLARGLTYVLMWLKPPRSVLPSRPPTELLASFGLTSGGIIFMASSGDTVAGMVHQNLDAMFMYTVTMGLVALLMAWVVIIMALKGWAVRKEAARRPGSYRAA